MNKIYKVVWSKAKNCYVVVSEFAKNVISGSVKSAKVGAMPVAKGMALGALMAFVITGSAWAENSGEGSSSTYGGDYGIEAGKGNTVVLDDLELHVTNTIDRDEDNYFAIRATETGSVTVKNLNAIVKGEKWVAGVEATNEAVVTLGNAILNIEDDGCSEAYGINVARKGTVNVNGNFKCHSYWWGMG